MVGSVLAQDAVGIAIERAGVSDPDPWRDGDWELLELHGTGRGIPGLKALDGGFQSLDMRFHYGSDQAFACLDGVGSAEAAAGSRKEAEALAASRLLASRLGASGAPDCRGEPHLV